MTLEKQIKLAKANGTYERFYGELVEKKIREKYSVGEELAILRQRDTKQDEFNIYNNYVEFCKKEVKQVLEKYVG